MTDDNDDNGGVPRRDVLKASGAFAALGLGGSGLQSLVPMDESESINESGVPNFIGQAETVETACGPNCWQSCPIEVDVRDGRVVNERKQVPEDERYSRICQRGVSHVQRINNPERLKYPMKRVDWAPDQPNVNGRGPDAKWERISWEEAWDLIAEKWQSLIDEHGARSIWVKQGSGNYGNVNGGLMGGPEGKLNALMGGTTSGAGAIDMNVEHGYIGVRGGFGFGPYFNEPTDWTNTDTFVYWGCSALDSQPQEAKFALDANREGAELIVVDPRYSSTASKADTWVPVQEGTDAALLLGMIRHVLDADLIDESFCRDHTVAPFLVSEETDKFVRSGDGEDEQYLVYDAAQEAVVPVADAEQPALFGTYTVVGEETTTALTRLRGHVDEWTLEQTADLTDVDPATITHVAEAIAAPGGGSIIRHGMGTDRYQYGNTVGQATAILSAITGNFGKSGASSGIGPFYGFALLNPAWQYPEGDNQEVLAAAANMASAIANQDPYPVKAAFFSFSNLVNQYPDRTEWLDGAFPQLEAVVTADLFMTDTAKYSDIVLPAAHYFEATDVLTGATHPHVTLRKRVVDPPWEVKSDFEIVKGLAERLGYGEYFEGSLEENVKDYLDHELFRDRDVSYEKLKQQGTVRHLPDPYIPFEGGEFPTETGRANIYAEAAVDQGMPEPTKAFNVDAPLPEWKWSPEIAPNSQEAEEYPLTYSQQHNRYRTHSQYRGNPWLREEDPEPTVKINPRDAKERGIDDGDYVRLFNDRGEVFLKARYHEGMRPGHLDADQGWWSDDYVKGHHQTLTHSEVNPISKNWSFFDVRVEVEPAPADLDTSMYTEGNPHGAGADTPAGGD